MPAPVVLGRKEILRWTLQNDAVSNSQCGTEPLAANIPSISSIKTWYACSPLLISRSYPQRWQRLGSRIHSDPIIFSLPWEIEQHLQQIARMLVVNMARLHQHRQPALALQPETFWPTWTTPKYSRTHRHRRQPRSRAWPIKRYGSTQASS